MKKSKNKQIPIEDEIKTEYPYLFKLGAKIHYDKPILYVDSGEFAKILKKNKIEEKFSEFYGHQTAFHLDNGNSGLYLHDCEAILHRIYKNELIGTQKYFD